jgi:hypothetical protein
MPDPRGGLISILYQKGQINPDVHLENLKITIPILPREFHSPKIAQCAFALLGRKMGHLHKPSCNHSKMIQT